jgi:DNA-binding NarL/FixJ family response regulator
MPRGKKTPPELSDRDWIIDQKRAGLTNKAIAKKIGVSEATVGKAYKNHNIKRPYLIVHNPDLIPFTPHNLQK